MIDKSLQKDQKYFFNHNIFDDGSAKTEQFTAKDIEDARRRSFAEGTTQASKEQESSREQRVAQALQRIEQQLLQLTQAEKTREDYYEQETLNLVMLVFRRLFPLLDKTHGLAEMKDYLAKVLTNQDQHPAMNIHVPVEIVNEIKDYVSQLKNAGSDIQCVVTGDEKLHETACTVSWADGGTMRDPSKLAADIEAAVQEILAVRTAKGHDKEIESDNNGEPA